MPATFTNPDLAKVIPKLGLLRHDLIGISCGGGPTMAMLAEAPVIEDWHIRLVATPVIEGWVLGHPKLPDGPVATTAIWYLNGEPTWVRTLSRYYRLGRREQG